MYELRTEMNYGPNTSFLLSTILLTDRPFVDFTRNFSDTFVPTSLRGAFKSNFWKNLGIWPNQVDPPPSPKVGTPKTKKKILMFILHFRLF